MSVSANQVIRRAAGERRSFPVASGVHIYENTLVYINASGYADAVTANGANKFAGVATHEADNSGGGNGAIQVEVYAEGDFHLFGSSFAQSSVGLDAFGLDNFTVDDADGSTAVRIGTVVGYVSATCIVIAIETEAYAQGAALTTALTTLTTTAPGAADYTATITNASPYGFSSADKANTVMSVIKNLQQRVNDLESRLKAAGLIA